MLNLVSVLFMAALETQAPQTPPVDNTEAELLALLNTPVSGASKREQRLIDSPQAIEVLTGEEIRQMGIFRLQDALKLMTGIDIIEADNGFSVVGMRGVMQQGQPRTVQVLIDGVPLYNAYASSIDLNNLPISIDMIDRVEVVRGPSSTLYGANAVVGVIAITSRKAGEGIHGAARAARADKQTSRWAATMDGGTHSWGFSAGFQGASLGNSGQNVYMVGDTAHQMPYPMSDGGFPNPSHQFSGLAKAEFRNEHSSLWFSAGDASKVLGQSQEILSRRFEVRTFLAGWHETWSDRFSTEVRLHQTRDLFYFHMEDSLADGYSTLRQALGLSAVDIAGNYNFGDSTTSQAEIQANWDPSQDLHFVAGLDTREVKATEVLFLGLENDDKETASGAFLAMDWTFTPRWTLSMGARVENETLGGSRTSPRFTLVWAPTATSVIRAGYYTSTRSPQLTEERVNYVFPSIPDPVNHPYDVAVSTISPNPNLDPEKTAMFELGYRQSIGPATVDLTVYRLTLRGQISQVNLQTSVLPGMTEAAAQFQNVGDATNKGAELALTYALEKNWKIGLSGRYLDYSRNDPGTGPSQLGSSFSYAPKTLLTAWTRFARGAFSGYLDLQRVDSCDVEALSANGVTQFGSRPSHLQADAQFNYEFFPGFTGGVYARNAAREFTPQGATGPDRPTYFQSARRELGVTLGYRF